MCPIALNVKEARKETAKQNSVLLSYLLQNILCWGKHCIDKEGGGGGGKEVCSVKSTSYHSPKKKQV